MIRPFTLITMLLAALSGAYMFAVKHRAQVLDDQLAETSQQSRLDAQRIRVLQAQWALETDPTRLAALAAQFTSLQPMKPVQLVTLAALPAALPVAGSAAPGSNPAAPITAMPVPGPNGMTVAQAMPSLPLPPPAPPAAPEPAMLANAMPRPPAAPYQANHKVSHSALEMASIHLVKLLPPPQPQYAEARPNLPVGARVVAVKAAADPPYFAANPLPPASGSALGMAADLAPPQPLPSGGDSH